MSSVRVELGHRRFSTGSELGHREVSAGRVRSY